MNLIGPGAADAAAAYPELRHLVDLRERGWSFLPVKPRRTRSTGFDVGTVVGVTIRIKDSGTALGLQLDRDHAISALARFLSIGIDRRGRTSVRVGEMWDVLTHPAIGECFVSERSRDDRSPQLRLSRTVPSTSVCLTRRACAAALH
ncbi:hypothetical protein [Saccharothrix hoggarensis]|uniref:Uncharacterized protein n=1 Tax=Saccharothrix hoggarensis TaxID=913853 RepID=A0ABW3QVK1_9PSEU